MFLFGKGRKKSAARDVVAQWESSQVSNIASELLKIIPNQVPLLRDIASSSLEGIINKNIGFFALEPVEISNDLYNVTDTVRVKVGHGIPFVGKQFSVSINYSVKVDVKAKKVVEANIDLLSLKIDFA